MTKYPVFHRWIPEEPPPILHGYSVQLEGRLQEIDALLNVNPEEDDDVANIPLPSDPGQPGNPIVISDDEEPFATIEELLKNSAEEDNVEASAVTAPPSSSAEPGTEGGSALEDPELSSAAVSMEVVEDTLEEAMDNVNDLSNGDLEDSLHHAEENVVEDSMDNSTDALKEAVENAFEEVIENILEIAIEAALDEATDSVAEDAVENALKETEDDMAKEAENNALEDSEDSVAKEAEDHALEDSNELNEEHVAYGVVQEVSENVEAVDEDPANEMVQEISENMEAVDEVPAIDEAAQELLEDPEALEEGPEEDPFLPEVGLEGEDFTPLATSAMKSTSAEASVSGASPSYQEKPRLTIWSAIFYPVPEVFVNLRFRGKDSYHLRHIPVEDRPGEYHGFRWPLSAQIPAGILFNFIFKIQLFNFLKYFLGFQGPVNHLTCGLCTFAQTMGFADVDDMFLRWNTDESDVLYACFGCGLVIGSNWSLLETHNRAWHSGDWNSPLQVCQVCFYRLVYRHSMVWYG